jgi:hypothetical protein
LASSDPEAIQKPTHGLINHKARKALDLRDGWEDEESCIATVELTETVSVPSISGRIAGDRVVRHSGSKETTTPLNKVAMVDPVLQCVPGIYLVQRVATLSYDVSNEISSGACSSPHWSEVPLGSKCTAKLNSPCDNVDEKTQTFRDKARLGEHQTESPRRRSNC